MKKSIPFIFPIVFGVFGGLFVECLMCVLSIMVSPFSTYAVAPFFYFCLFVSVLAAAITIVMLIVNVIHLVNLDNDRKVKLVIVAQAIVGIALLLLSWWLWSAVFGELVKIL